MIEDIDPTNDKILVTFDGSAAPQLSYTISDGNVVWTDDKGYFNLTLKGSSDAGDYYEGEAHEYIWDILRITNEEREQQNLEALTLSQGLEDGASIRAQELVETYSHTRPDGTSCFTAVEKSYWSMGENIAVGQTSPEEVMTAWMNSTGHRANILNSDFTKLGAGYVYDSTSEYKYHWVQMFGGDLMSDTLSTAKILTTTITATRGTLPEEETATVNTVLAEGNTSIRRGGTYKITKNFSGKIRINTSDAVTIDATSAGNLSGVQIVAFNDNTNLTIKNLNVANDTGGVITFGAGTNNKLTLAGTNTLKTSDTWAAVVGVGSGLIVDGSGALNLTAGTQGSGIGYNSYGDSTANIIIKNGSITTSTSMGAGIGSGSNGSIGNISITGGTVVASSEWAAGVGAGWSGSVGNILFNGSNDDDNISVNGNNATISGGKGNDTIKSSGSNVLFVYDSGDGNDSIAGFDATSTLQVSENFSSVKSGNNLIVTVDGGKITLQGAASLSSANIIKTKKDSTLLIVTDSTKFPLTIDSAIKTVDASNISKGTKITGNELNNSIVGGSGKDYLVGAAGDDSIFGNAGNDKLLGDAGKYKLNGGAGNDTLDGGASNDTLDGGTGNDTLTGGKAHDKLYGSAGNDLLSGGTGNDSLWGGAGNDSLWGDDGSDKFIYAKGDGKDVIFGFDDNDTLKLDGLDFTASYKSNAVTLTFDDGSITLKNFSATTFHIDDDVYKIIGTKLVKK